MADIKIPGVSQSTFTRTVRLACHEKGIDYELVPMLPDQMGALNPFQKIPAITHWSHSATCRESCGHSFWPGKVRSR